MKLKVVILSIVWLAVKAVNVSLIDIDDRFFNLEVELRVSIEPVLLSCEHEYRELIKSLTEFKIMMSDLEDVVVDFVSERAAKLCNLFEEGDNLSFKLFEGTSRLRKKRTELQDLNVELKCLETDEKLDDEEANLMSDLIESIDNKLSELDFIELSTSNLPDKFTLQSSTLADQFYKFLKPQLDLYKGEAEMINDELELLLESYEITALKSELLSLVNGKLTAYTEIFEIYENIVAAIEALSKSFLLICPSIEEPSLENNCHLLREKVAKLNMDFRIDGHLNDQLDKVDIREDNFEMEKYRNEYLFYKFLQEKNKSYLYNLPSYKKTFGFINNNRAIPFEPIEGDKYHFGVMYGSLILTIDTEVSEEQENLSAIKPYVEKWQTFESKLIYPHTNPEYFEQSSLSCVTSILNSRGIRELRQRILAQFYHAVKFNFNSMIIPRISAESSGLNLKQVADLYREASELFTGHSLMIVYILDHELSDEISKHY